MAHSPKAWEGKGEDAVRAQPLFLATRSGVSPVLPMSVRPRAHRVLGVQGKKELL